MKADRNQIRAALSSPSPATRLILLHGPDEAGADEMARQFGKAVGADAERVDLDGAMLKGDPGRLATEAASLSLFGGTRFIRVTGMGEESLEAVALLLGAEQAGNPAVAIGPSLKTTGKLLKLVLGARNALAFACYPMKVEDAERAAVALAREHGLRVTGGVSHRLVEASGGDRAVLAREIEKLALFLDAAPDRPRDLDDAVIDAVGADLSDATLTRAVEAAIDGETAQIGVELARLEEAGMSVVPLLRQLARRLMALAEMRAEIDAGAGVSDTIARHKIFFRDQPSTTRALRRWTSPRLAEAVARARRAERAVTSAANAGDVLARAELVAVARVAARLS